MTGGLIAANGRHGFQFPNERGDWTPEAQRTVATSALDAQTLCGFLERKRPNYLRENHFAIAGWLWNAASPRPSVQLSWPHVGRPGIHCADDVCNGLYGLEAAVG